MEEVSYDWLRLVEKALVKQEQLPPLEETFPFPWSEASTAIGAALEIDPLNISALRTVWKGPEELLKGLGESPLIVSIEMSPIEGSVFFVMPQKDVFYLTGQALVAGEKKEGLSNKKLAEGFYYFLLLKVVQAIDGLKIFKDVSLHLAPMTQLPSESALCIDLTCSFPEKTIESRLICPQSFLSAFKAYQPLQKSSLLASDIIQDIEVVLRTEVGYTTLSKDEWEKVQVGDFIILDRCSYDPKDGKGSVTLLLGDTPLIIARMKTEGMKVLDFAFYREQQEQQAAENQIFLTAEIGKVRIPLNKLLYLQPGSMLDLSMRPEQGVDIMLGTKKIATGELLKLGETVGLRILNVEQ